MFQSSPAPKSWRNRYLRTNWAWIKLVSILASPEELAQRKEIEKWTR